jgi:DNA polymerase-3 subunit gamma/tau
LPAQALYLKWRPQTFEDVIGQEHITRTLRNALRQNRIRHAYLFSGPRGTGKTSTARLLAKAVNCQHPDPDRRPCNECAHCIAVNEGRYLDLIEIDAASHTSVDDVRDLRDKIAFAPGEGLYKVYIIDEVHRFSGAAFDALLKTLEEPPAHAIFVLATTEIAKVPATIKSRCLAFEFRRVSLNEVVERLAWIAETEGVSIDHAALELVAREGTGSVRDSISLLDQLLSDPGLHISLELAEQVLGTASGQNVVDLAQAIIDQDSARGLDVINTTVDAGADPRQFGRQVIEHLRQVLLVKLAGDGMVDATAERRAVLRQQADAVGHGALLTALRAFNGALQDWQGGWLPQLPLELALLEGLKPAADSAPEPAPRPRAAQPAPAAPPGVPAAAAPAPASSGTIRVADVKALWPRVRDVVKTHHRSAYPLLDHATPREVRGDLLMLSVQEAIFKQKLEAPDTRSVLEAALGEVFGVAFKVKIILADESGQRPKGASELVAQDDVLAFGVNELGGEITDFEE